MKTAKAATIITAAAFFLVLAGTTADAGKKGSANVQEKDGFHRPGPPGGLGPLGMLDFGIMGALRHDAAQLGLSVNQKENLKKLRSDFRTAVKPLRDEIRKLHEATITELKKGKVYKNKLKARHERAQELRNKIDDLRFDLVMDMFEVLSKKQQEKLFDILEKRAEKKGFGPGKGPAPGMGPGQGPGQGEGPRK